MESSVGAAGMQYSWKVYSLPDSHAPLFKRQNGDGETRSVQGCVTVVMHEWLFLLSVPAPSLKDVVHMEWAKCSRKHRREAAEWRVALVRKNTMSLYKNDLIKFVYMGINTDLEWMSN